MPRPFHQATAEQVVIVAEAVVSLGEQDAATIAAFTDLPEDTATSALDLADDLGLLQLSGANYAVESPLCNLLRTPHDTQKAAILRAFLESYEPFLVFREEHEATGNVTSAAQRAKVKLDLDCHREKVKETLLNLATFTGAMTASQGNTYERDARGLTALLDELAQGSREVAEATLTIRNELGNFADEVDNAQVLQPLVAGLRHAAAGNAREAVLQAGIACENFLTAAAQYHATDIAGAHGINAKMDRLINGEYYPKKLQNVSKYVGHVRNAADHGADQDIGAPWDISRETGRNYVFVTAGLIRAMLDHRLGQHSI